MKWYVFNTGEYGEEDTYREIFLHTGNVNLSSGWRCLQSVIDVDGIYHCEFKTKEDAIEAMENATDKLPSDIVINGSELMVYVL
jgi:hypothetical protein